MDPASTDVFDADRPPLGRPASEWAAIHRRARVEYARRRAIAGRLEQLLAAVLQHRPLDETADTLRHVADTIDDDPGVQHDREVSRAIRTDETRELEVAA